MTTHITAPFLHVEDANGLPYVGAKLYVYTPATTTLSSLYSDEALSVAITNPLTSDASGNFARAYAAAGKYKLRTETSAGVLIWEYDNVDIGLGFGGGPLAITAGGTGATSAASALTALGAASSASVTSLADDISDIQATLRNIVTVPQGYLTLTTATPVITGDVSAATSVYYTPYVGNLCPIWDGTQYNIHQFSELTLTLDANHLANSIYDVFITLDAGVPIVVTGPVWNTVTAGAGARGTGSGTTELERKNGLFTNKNSMTARNGATTYTVDANEATYVGSIYMDGSNGQISCHRTYGQNRKWGVWNCFNKNKIVLKAGDSNVSWLYTTATIRPAQGSTSNKVTAFCGLVEGQVVSRLRNVVSPDNGGTAQIGVGWNSTTAMSGYASDRDSFGSGKAPLTAEYDVIPNVGINNVTALEVSNGTNATTYYGTELRMLLTTEFWG